MWHPQSFSLNRLALLFLLAIPISAVQLTPEERRFWARLNDEVVTTQDNFLFQGSDSTDLQPPKIPEWLFDIPPPETSRSFPPVAPPHVLRSNAPYTSAPNQRGMASPVNQFLAQPLPPPPPPPPGVFPQTPGTMLSNALNDLYLISPSVFQPESNPFDISFGADARTQPPPPPLFGFTPLHDPFVTLPSMTPGPSTMGAAQPITGAASVWSDTYPSLEWNALSTPVAAPSTLPPSVTYFDPPPNVPPPSTDAPPLLSHVQDGRVTKSRSQRISAQPSRGRRLPKASVNERQWVCDVCEFAFSRQGNLFLFSSSTAIHSTNRFGYVEHLKRHKRSHTNERPFLCPYCGNSFTRSDNFRVHLTLHENSKHVSTEHTQKQTTIRSDKKGET